MSDHPLAPYLSPEQREAQLDRLATVLAAELHLLGRSVEGRPIRALRLPRLGERSAVDARSDESDPAVLLCANIHGVELIASAVAIGVLEALGAVGADVDSPMGSLRRRAEIWVVPSLNPDGYARSWQREGHGTLAELRPNAHGVDLNRNFPLPGSQPWYALSLGGWATGSSEPGNAFYKGSHALSEPETASLEQLLAWRGFHAGVNLHSCMGRLIPPYVRERAAFDVYGELCAAFSAAQPQRRYRRLAARRINWFTGEQEDHQHHAHGTWAICVEHFPLGASYRQHLRAPCTFWRFNPRDPRPWIENDVPGIVAYFHAALDRPRPAPTCGLPPSTTRPIVGP